MELDKYQQAWKAEGAQMRVWYYFNCAAKLVKGKCGQVCFNYIFYLCVLCVCFIICMCGILGCLFRDAKFVRKGVRPAREGSRSLKIPLGYRNIHHVLGVF